MSEPFIAEIRIWGGSFAPRGWSFCNGQLLPISQNTALFSLIGTIYGGDGRTTTGLPNLQGRAPMHWGNGPGLTPRKIGDKGGVTDVTLTEAQMPAHNHLINATTEDNNRQSPASATFGGNLAMYFPPGSNPTLGEMAQQVLDNAGGSLPHTNMQPYLTLDFIIALVGMYPSRS